MTLLLDVSLPAAAMVRMLATGRHFPPVLWVCSQLPDVLFRPGQAVGDGLGRVDDAAAAHGQQEVDAVLLPMRMPS